MTDPSSDTRHASPAPPRHRLPAALAELCVAAVSVVLGYVLLELPWNDGLLTMEPRYAALNLAVLGLLFAVVYLAGQRTRIAAAVFVGACLLAGIANAYVVMFKGQPIVPADLFALSTAASVSSGYSFWPTARMLGAAGLFALYCIALWKAPLPPRRRGSKAERRARIGCNLAAAVLVALAAAGMYHSVDIGTRYDVTVDVWDVRGSYEAQGTALSFAQRTQELAPAAPEGYAPETADQLRREGAAWSKEHATAPSAVDDASGAPIRPHILAIMNETFSDLSRYPGLQDSALATPLVTSHVDGQAIGGDVVVSALGGGTCNSEFEFLTGASLGNLGGGAYPYVLYDLSEADNLVRSLDALGYGTHAIHPAEATNWSRSRVYHQLGFDTFDDIESFKADPAYEDGLFRQLVSDRTTYELALQLLDQGDEPQFVFDVTIQNHGGYETELVSEDQRVHVDTAPIDNAELDEFASCMAASEDDLSFLLGELEQRSYPVVVCFFGDHQPGFANDLFEAAYGTSVEGVPLEMVQERFTTPYLIWGNSAARQLGLADPAKVPGGTTSLNYLGALMMEASGLPLDEHLGFLSALRQVLPAINMNGYLAPDGQWRWFDQDGGIADALRAYEMVQHRNLFG